MGYTKLFQEILDSTVWAEPDHVRILWITMLAMRDQYHKVNASIPGLAYRARIPLEKCQEALECLSSPDKFSRTPDFEGRRIEKVDGGWVILNAEKYRKRLSQDERRAYRTEKQREYRARDKAETVDTGVDKRGQMSTAWTQEEEETKKEKKKEGADAPRLWDIARDILGGSLLGKNLKKFGEETVKSALTQTLLKDPADPKSYLMGCLNNGTHKEPSGRLSAVEATNAGIERYLKRKESGA